ncbi:hypothetical protein RRG08_008396 [Elysia crispata]|uniref:Superoxide dismutase copper/zinc binding domain-containing protein n=1 Tax=Elysia crispata TaxID=231223 RepID=A0AAE1EDL1_9GAST|nr:hypothetical protein RRG08_008396 [Elysia crispata]
MKLYQGLVLVCFLAQFVCQVQSKKRKGRGGRRDWRMERLQKMVSPMKEEIQLLQKTVEKISNPVHIHLHGVSGLDSSTADQLVVKDEDKHDHHDHDHHDKHHKHHKHHDHTRGGSDRHSGGNGASESQQAGAREDEEDNQDSPNQSHVHIHLKIAGELDGQRVETCPPQDDVYPKDEYTHACCHVMPNPAVITTHNLQGDVYLRQKPNEDIEVKVSVGGFDNSEKVISYHGFHVHELADIAGGCNAFGGHYNPGGHAHGGPDSDQKHAGDWGNIKAYRGASIDTFNASGTLYGRESMFGRGIVIHIGKDDLGKGGTHSSRTTGSAGARIACCVIGHCKGKNWD